MNQNGEIKKYNINGLSNLKLPFIYGEPKCLHPLYSMDYITFNESYFPPSFQQGVKIHVSYHVVVDYYHQTPIGCPIIGGVMFSNNNFIEEGLKNYPAKFYSPYFTS